MHENSAGRGWSRLAAGLVVVVMASALAVAAPAATASGANATKLTASNTAGPAAAKLDINAASKEDLAKLPGIGAVYSQKIIDGRPYKTKAELESKKILPKGVYDKITALIIAHQK